MTESHDAAGLESAPADGSAADKTAKPTMVRPPADSMADGGFHQSYLLLVRLCELRARPPVIRNLVPKYISKALINATYRTITGKNPPPGQLPLSISQCLETRTLRLHTTAVLALHSRYADIVVEQQYVKTYEAYVAMMGSEWVFDFNRVWFLCRAHALRRLRLIRCQSCENSFAVDHEIVTDAKNCPVCSVIRTTMPTVAKAAEAPALHDDLEAGRNQKRLARVRIRETE